jgi:hypothetical protein
MDLPPPPGGGPTKGKRNYTRRLRGPVVDVVGLGGYSGWVGI